MLINTQVKGACYINIALHTSRHWWGRNFSLSQHITWKHSAM